MFQTIEMPIWALVLIGVLAAVTAASHLLFPSVRWFFRRRAERVVARLNTRLTRPIEPFKLAERPDMIRQILFDPGVIAAVNAHADKMGIPEDVAFETAQRYAREIVPSFSASLYFGIGTRAAKWLANSFYRVRVINPHQAEIDAIPREATVIYVMNHRSNMDYVLVTYLAARETALSYAVGEWARGWPLRPLIRMMGGYFIRRKNLNQLYRKVLARYVQLSTKNGVTQAIFPEGRLSREGSLMSPKLGLLNYIVESFDTDGQNDVVFVPVGLNYDRVLEDKVLIAASGNDRARFRLRVSTAMIYVLRHLWYRVTGRFKGLGFAVVSFGSPVSLRSVLKDAPEDQTAALGELLMEKVAATVPVLPVPLIARELEAANGRLAFSELRERFGASVRGLEQTAADVRLPDDGPAKPFHDAVHMLELRGILERDGDVVAVRPGFESLIAYYAASISHIYTT